MTNRATPSTPNDRILEKLLRANRDLRVRVFKASKTLDKALELRQQQQKIKSLENERAASVSREEFGKMSKEIKELYATVIKLQNESRDLTSKLDDKETQRSIKVFVALIAQIKAAKLKRDILRSEADTVAKIIKDTKSKVVDNSDFEEKAAALKGEIKLANDEYRGLREMQRKMEKERGEADAGFNGSRLTRAIALHERRTLKLREYQGNLHEESDYSPRPPQTQKRRRSTLTSDDKVKIAQRAINQEMDIQEAAERDADAEEARFEKEVARMKKIIEKMDVSIHQLKAETTRLEALKVKFDSQKNSQDTSDRQVQAADGTLSTPEALRDIFLHYCRFGKTGKRKNDDTSMEGSMFAKLCKDCPGLLQDGAAPSPAECDLIFATAKPKLERRLGFSHFLAALNLVAAKRYPNKTRDGAFDALLTDHVLKLPTVRLTSKRASMRTPSIVALIEPKIRLPGEKENRFFRF